SDAARAGRVWRGSSARLGEERTPPRRRASCRGEGNLRFFRGARADGDAMGMGAAAIGGGRLGAAPGPGPGREVGGQLLSCLRRIMRLCEGYGVPAAFTTTTPLMPA